MDRRSFLKTAAAGTAGAALAWRFGGTLALAQLPDETSSLPVDEWEDGLKLSNRKMLGTAGSIKCEQPSVASSLGGVLFATWIEEDDTGEHLMATSFHGDKFGETKLVSDGGNGRVAHPRMRQCRSGAQVVWSEQRAFGNWIIATCHLDQIGGRELRELDPDTGTCVRLNEPGIAWRPDLAETSDGTLWIVYERKKTARFEIVARTLKNQEWGPEVAISAAPEEDCCRPSCVADAKGNFWISWDQTDGYGGPHVWLARLEKGAVHERVQVTHHPAENVASSLAHDGKRVWIAWHSNRCETDMWDIPRWFYLRSYADGVFEEPIGEPVGKDLAKKSTDQSFEFPRVFAAPDGRIIVTGRPSHNFCFQWYGAEGWSPLYRVPEDGWGGRGQFLEGAFGSGGFWIARRDLNANVLHCIDILFAQPQELKLAKHTPRTDLARVPSNAVRRRPQWDPLDKLEGIDKPLNIYYGDIHGHTWMSDGMGDADEYYRIRHHYYADDFCSLTDHDTFVGNGLLPSEFEFIKEMTAHWHKDGHFVTLYGQEYTTAHYPKAIGHKCIYSLNPEIPLFDHTDEDANTSQKLNGLVKKWNALIFPHHTGWTGTDWENADPEIQMIAEIVSNHGRFEYMGNTPIPHRGGARGCFIQDGLARGLKFGFIGGADNHGLIWHHRAGWKRDSYRTGIACVLAPELTREAIFDALRRRRTFAATGIKPRLDFRVNGHLMGEEIELGAKEPVVISFDVTCHEAELKWLQIVRNNETWYSYGGEGWQSKVTVRDTDILPGTAWYYLRVEFETGDMAWSSPVWVTRRAT